MSFGNQYPIKSCGKAHAWCGVCSPGTAKKRFGVKKGDWGHDYDPDEFARGYVPHPTKTMWERHRETHNMPIEHTTQRGEDWPEGYEPPRLIGLGDMKSRTTPNTQLYLSDIGTIEEVLKDVQETGRMFRAKELRWHFGFTTSMIRRYLQEERRQRKFLEKPEPVRKQIEDKRAARYERGKRILEMATNGYSTLADIGKEVGLTREGVRQALLVIEKREGIKIPRNHPRGEEFLARQEPVLMVAIRCRYCKKVVEVPEKKATKWRQGFCKEHAVSKNIWSFIEAGADWYGADGNGRERIRYNYDPNRKAKSKLYARLWKDKIRKDPVKWARFKQLENASIARYTAKMKAKKEAEMKGKIRPFDPMH